MSESKIDIDEINNLIKPVVRHKDSGDAKIPFRLSNSIELSNYALLLRKSPLHISRQKNDLNIFEANQRGLNKI